MSKSTANPVIRDPGMNSESFDTKLRKSIHMYVKLKV